MGTRWISDTDRAVQTWMGWLRTPAAEGPLEHIALEDRAFGPGHRTADRGALASAGGDQGVADFAARGVGGRVQWELRDPRADPPEQVAQTALDAARPVRVHATEGGPFVLRCQPEQGEAGQILVSVPYLVVVDAPRAPLDPALEALGVPEGARDRVWRAVLVAANRVAAHVLRPANVRLLWRADGLWPDPDGDASPLPEPPAWVADPTAIPQDGALRARRATSGADATPPMRHILVTAPVTLDDVIAAVGTWSTRLRDLGVIGPAGFALDMLEDPEAMRPAWGYGGFFEGLRCGVAMEGLGGLTALGVPLAEGAPTAADEALAALWAAVGAGEVDEARFAEHAGRRLGVVIARAALRLVGSRALHTAAEAPGDPDAPPPALTDLLGPAPLDPLRDLLGLHRPEGAQTGEIGAHLSAQQGAGDPSRWFDLVEHFRALWQAPVDRTSGYDVLAGLVDPDHLASIEVMAPLPAPYGRHALQAGNLDAELDDQGVVATAARYGEDGGDPDDRRTAIADLQDDLRRVGITLGLEVRGKYAYRRGGLDAQGNRTDAIWDGHPGTAPIRMVGLAQRQEMMLGHTDWAVREFQIACNYPNTVVERLDAAVPYTGRLRVAVAGDPVDPPGHNTPAGEESVDARPPIDGRLTVADALELRRWVLARRRYPVVVEARATSAARNWSVLRHENLQATNGLDETGPRMFVLDHSGHVPPAERHANQVAPAHPGLGHWTAHGGWSGPQATTGGNPPHTLARVSLTATFDGQDDVWQDPPEEDDEDDDGQDNGDGQENGDGQDDGGQEDGEADGGGDNDERDWVRRAFRLVDAVTRHETGGYYDGFNAYDRSVFSYPLFHFTLRLGGHAQNDPDGHGKPGLFGAFVRWLQHPPGGLSTDAAEAQAIQEAIHREYQTAFGAFGVGAGPQSGNTAYLHVGGLRRVASAAGDWHADMAGAAWQDNTAAARRQQALFQVYSEWFRTWPWFARFAAVLRGRPGMRRLTIAYGIQWSHDILARNRGNAPVRDTLTSELTCAMWVRMMVYNPGQAANAWNAANMNGTQQQIADAMRTHFAEGTSLRDNLDGINNYNGGTDGLGQLDRAADSMPTLAQLLDARNRVLRSLLAPADDDPQDEE